MVWPEWYPPAQCHEHLTDIIRCALALADMAPISSSALMLSMLVPVPNNATTACL